MHGHADRARVVRDRALHGLANPPGRIRGELEAAAPVELLDGAVQAERALLDKVEKWNAESSITLGNGDDQAQVRLDHPPFGGRVAALDGLREGDLLGRGEELVAPDVRQEELEAVGRAGKNLRLRRRRLGLACLGGLRLPDLE